MIYIYVFLGLNEELTTRFTGQIFRFKITQTKMHIKLKSREWAGEKWVIEHVSGFGNGQIKAQLRTWLWENGAKLGCFLPSSRIETDVLRPVFMDGIFSELLLPLKTSSKWNLARVGFIGGEAIGKANECVEYERN